MPVTTTDLILPTTKNGDTISPGMTIYDRCGGVFIVDEIVLSCRSKSIELDDSYDPMEKATGILVYAHHPGGLPRRIRWHACYSTAEAAASANGGGE